MIGPRKKIAIRKKRIRHAQWQKNKLRKLNNFTNLVKCSNCDKYKLSHRVCPHCGFYGDKQVLTIKQKEKTNIIES